MKHAALLGSAPAHFLGPVGTKLIFGFTELRQEMQVGFAALETRFERRFGDLIKRSFVFWVGAVGSNRDACSSLYLADRWQ